MKKILVTGGLGFIGSHLVEELAANEDCSIDIVDNLANNSIDPSDVASSKINKIHTCSVEEFDFKEKYDEIYHLASPVGPAGVLKYAGRMGPMILNDVIKIAEYASETDAKVIFISTSEVYGFDPGHKAQREDINKVVPAKITTRLEYGVAKLITEICLHNFAKHNPIKYNIIRPFNIVGVGQSSKAGFVLPRFTLAALTGKDITVFGDGTQVRTFTHVKDIVSGIIKIMNSDISGEIFNIGNPANQHSILEVAEIVKEMTKSNSNIIKIDPKKVYGKHYEEAWNKIPDIAKIKELVNWIPKYSFREIVKEVIEDFNSQIGEGKLRPNQGL